MDMNLDLHNRRTRLQMLLSLRKSHRSETTQAIANFGWQIAGGLPVMKFTS